MISGNETSSEGISAAEIIDLSGDDALTGYVVIDSTVHGQSGGGLRIAENVDVELLTKLARTMTLKYGFYWIPKGGAKAGIRFNPEGDPQQIDKLLIAFGKRIRPLLESRRYFPGPDMGTDADDIRTVLDASGTTQRNQKQWNTEESGLLTAAGVMGAFIGTNEHLNWEARSGTAIVEGTGAVGGALMRRLSRQGVKILGVANKQGAIHREGGIDYDSWRQFTTAGGSWTITDFPGAEVVDRKDFYSIPATTFFPCAGSLYITPDSARRIVAKVIISGANNPFVRDESDFFHEKGIVVVPDFVANAGGVLGGAFLFGGLNTVESATQVEAIIKTGVDRVLRDSDRSGNPPDVEARNIAMTRFEEVRRATASRLIRAGLAMRRRGLLPGGISRAATLHHARRLRNDVKER